MLTFELNKNIQDIIRPNTFVEDRPATADGRIWWGYVWVKALEGNVTSNVNLDAYGYKCTHYEKMGQADQEVALLTTTEIKSGARGVADTVANAIDLNIDKIVESSEVNTLVMEFKQVHESLLISEGVNLWRIFHQAINQNRRMVDKLREIVKKYSLENLIESILRNQDAVPALEGSFAC